MLTFNCDDVIFKDYLNRFRDNIRQVIMNEPFILEVINKLYLTLNLISNLLIILDLGDIRYQCLISRK